MTASRSAIRRLDYTAPAYLIDRVDLTFELDEHSTRVLSRLVVKRNADTAEGTPLVLHGEELTLEAVKLDGALLSPEQYTLSERDITLPAIADTAILEICTRIDPAANTALSGLYASNGNFITQCEAEGFRRITYYLDRPDVMAKFTTTIIADKARYPVLLSNGNRVGSGNSDKGRHWVKWVDPFRKPAYLFALVAGRFVALTDTFVTASGRNVALEIHVEPGNLDKCHHAMAAAKKAMRWDEERFGLEYDLDAYMIVATSDFNMGAMENKGLNVFNTKYVLARPDTATDADFDGIDSVVAHEYFHNWTGNRVTCRDWFQLSLKEGLTVYRDQEFSSDLGSRAVQRIQNVRSLREAQFAEDSGPQAHPIRPDEYLEINNFYTWTVYEKGAEVVRMYATLLGRDGFRKGMDLYFKRHDGQAVTCDDFRAAMADANGVDLEQFGLWYKQAGTPVLDVEGVYDDTARTWTLTVKQHTPATPGQPDKLPLHLPLTVGLLDRRGQELPLRLSGETVATGGSRVLALRNAVETFTFVDMPCQPVPSLLRDFSAPVRLNYAYTDDELVFLMANDNDAFARWEAANTYAGNLLRNAYHALGRDEAAEVPQQFIDAFAKLLANEQLDPALVALMLELPSENALFEALNEVDPGRVHQARQTVKETLARELRALFLAIYQRLNDGSAYHYDGDAVARRSLKNVCLDYLAELDEPMIAELLANQYRRADNMTDRLAALAALTQRDDGEPFLADFGNVWQDDALVMDKWFALAATSSRAGALSRVEALMQHPAFSLKNPNKVRALIGAFCLRNPQHFHAADGYGYAFAADRIIELDAINPQIAARMASCFNRWTKLEPARRAMMKGELERIAAVAGLSPDTFEIVSKALAV
ncbi:aminopeptidase N [Andreprevotia lacus DSM 23236]|jgi:aminopeptidase N|uniref:Aminopeptidase N n=1 Tax=Andreprevotia lacus DSM 23236 TaxID=1121001 RepID=A0A1W1X9A1_9NEIS|nr:aminopeptidase N [Andreprevotia lacus]SMC20434.1 aminopeptidase N [Andreprevotia lacus DSM 23236]